MIAIVIVKHSQTVYFNALQEYALARFDAFFEQKKIWGGSNQRQLTNSSSDCAGGGWCCHLPPSWGTRHCTIPLPETKVKRSAANSGGPAKNPDKKHLMLAFMIDQRNAVVFCYCLGHMLTCFRCMLGRRASMWGSSLLHVHIPNT